MVLSFRRLSSNLGKTNSKLSASDPDLNRYLRGILKAQSRIYQLCKETDLQFAPGLSKLLNNNVYLKREDQQPVFSFKLRGAFNKIASLTEKEKENGIVACSAGNHAQGVALSASKLGLENLIIMPEATPKIKVEAVKKFGGNVLLHGKNYDEAQQLALEKQASQKMTLIHPFDAFEVISGQGTIGMEILKQVPESPFACFGCVGGGGLVAGMGTYIKLLSPETKMLGVETFDANALTQSLQQNRRVSLKEVGLFADGAAVRTPGEHTFALCQKVVDEMVNVSTDDVCQAMKLTFNDTRVIVEPAGALGVAGLVKYVEETGVRNKTLVAIMSGANIDFDRLRFVSERADRSESLLHVRIPEERGSFLRLYKHIFPRNVTEFSYRMKSGNVADILLSFQAKSNEDKTSVIDNLNDDGLSVDDLSDNEVAKTHIRHLAAGRFDAAHERLFNFEFPEAPGALNNFLQKMEGEFNVSLFHYRNHGADIGRVLVGMQVPPESEPAFDAFLKSLEFIYSEETSNPAYEKFLKA